MTTCPLCRSAELIRLETGFRQSMRSDGLVLHQPLTKNGCSHCGALVGNFVDVDQPYLRTNGLSGFDIARHARVADGLAAIAGRHHKCGDILEVGAASFQTAMQLAKRVAPVRITAIEPSPEVVPQTDGIDILTCRLEDADFERRFGLIYANHVLEHVPVTRDFLSRLAGIVLDDGAIVICCPNGLIPSHELLFADHLYHFTPFAIAAAARDVGLGLAETFAAPWDELSQVYVLRRQAAEMPAKHPDMTDGRTRFFHVWSEAGAQLAERAKGPLALFGAGEYSQLIRAYLPGLYDRVDRIVVDATSGARAFDRPVGLLSDTDMKGRTVLLGVHPKSAEAVARRVLAAGAARVLTVGEAAA